MAMSVRKSLLRRPKIDTTVSMKQLKANLIEDSRLIMEDDVISEPAMKILKRLKISLAERNPNTKDSTAKQTGSSGEHAPHPNDAPAAPQSAEATRLLIQSYDTRLG
jgi:hypothetical protein